jgi:hypothetical protein
MKNYSIRATILGAAILSVALIETSSLHAYEVSNKKEAASTLKSAGKAVENSFDREKVKDKAHDVTDSIVDTLSKQNINEAVDRVADYFDTEKMKETVDLIAAHFDKDKIKQTIDLVAEYLDKDKVKNFIDVTAEYLNREKIKESLDMLVDYVDKEKVKSTLDQGIDKVSDSLEKTVGYIKQEVAESRGDLSMVQKHLNAHDWKNIISDQATSDLATLSDLKLNGHKRVAIVKPGELIKGEVICFIDRHQLNSLSKYKVVLGIKKHEGPVTVYDHIGLLANKQTTNFELRAPKERGVYQVGFRLVKPNSENITEKNWDNKSDQTPTIGLIVVN